MKVLIIDNEKTLRDGLAEMLVLFCEDVTQVETATGVKTGLEKLSTYAPDILFLDVELDDGKGMDVIKGMETVPFDVVFITAHDKYAIHAFQFSALDFLLKPINPEALMATIEKAKDKKHLIDVEKQFNVLTEFYSQANDVNRKIIIKDRNSVYVVKISDIIRCESDNTYTTFFLNNNEQIVSTKSIKDHEELLENYGFIRVHQSHLINKHKIQRFDKADLYLFLEGGQHVPVAQRKKDQIIEILNNIS